MNERRIIKSRRIEVDGMDYEYDLARIVDPTTSTATYQGNIRAIGFGSPRHEFAFDAASNVRITADDVARRTVRHLITTQRALDEAGETIYVAVASMPGYASEAFENANTRVVGYNWHADEREGQDRFVTVYATTDPQALGAALDEAGNVGDRSTDDEECHEDFFPRPVLSSTRFADVMEYTHATLLALYVLGHLAEINA